MDLRDWYALIDVGIEMNVSLTMEVTGVKVFCFEIGISHF